MKKTLLKTSVILLAIFIAVIVTSCAANKSQQVGKLPKVTVGITTSPGVALIMIAKDKGFFKENGLDVDLRMFTSGAQALQAFLGGSLDFVGSGELPVTLAALQGHKFVVPAQVVGKTINAVRVIVRKDENVKSAYEYFHSKKRRISTHVGSGADFFTYEFLNTLGIEKDQVELISQKPEDMPAALVSGTVDAISIFDPYAFIAEQLMGDMGETFTEEAGYSELYIIDAPESIKENPSTIQKFLKSLINAEKFIEEYPEESKAIVMQYTKLDKKILDNIWNNFDFRVTLTNTLLETWQREAEWAKDTGKVTTDTPMPNFRDIIFDGPLKQIAPGAVELK